MERPRTESLRPILLGLLALGMLVTSMDLLLLDHHEDAWQLIPLILNAVGLAAVACHLLAQGRRSLRALQGAMALFVAAGLLGIVLHFQGNMEFQLDIDPSLSAWDLFWKVLRSKAPPALAPASMTHLGLLGLVFCYRHPVLKSKPD